MELRPTLSARQIAEMLGARVAGDPDRTVTGLNEINRVGPG
ncbi:MAG: UDP-3-O-(3-hydroxymyristoyl)glucosamine N-acyltransferase, partial [Flavobacteriales bacterium]|nr:UDP-3-O-(3-hydroxymyristoyl)glucosamine N-acyltransferase [Flavobacteriales bacterium]